MKKILLYSFISLLFISNVSWGQTENDWIGGNSAWTTTTNWSLGHTPTNAEAATFNSGGTATVTAVPTGTIQQLILSNSTTVNLQAGAAATVLTIGGGTGTDLNVPSGSALNISGANTMTITVATTATGSIAGTMDFTGAAHKLTAADASGITFQNGSTFTQDLLCTGNVFGATGTAGGVVFASGSTFISKAGSNPFSVAGAGALVIFQSGSLFSHQQTGAPSYSGRVYANFELNFATASITSTGASGFSADNFSVVSGVQNFNLTSNTNTIHIKGNISVSSGATLTFNPASTSPLTVLTLDGTSPQTITNSGGTLTFGANEGLTINNSNGVTLNSSISIQGPLTLTSGNITTTSSNLLTLGSSATISGASATSYVNGPLALTYSATGSKTFPIGSSTAYRPVTINATSLTGSGTITVSQTDANPGSTSLPGTIDKISIKRYWTITPAAGITAITSNIALTWGSDDGVSDLAHVTVVHGTHGGAWDVENSAGGTTGDATSGTITGNGFSSFSDFTFGNLNGGTNTLPVELNSFNALANGSQVNLAWTTATEVNNYGFEIERRQTSNVKSETWVKVGFVQAHGNSNSPQNYSFTDEPKGGKEFKYRLKQIDFNGAFEYSNEVNVEIAVPVKTVLNQNFPNPFNPTTKISYTIPQRVNVKLRVYDMLAQQVAELVNGTQEEGRYEVIFDGSNLPSGVYFYKLEAGSYVEVKKLLLIK